MRAQAELPVLHRGAGQERRPGAGFRRLVSIATVSLLPAMIGLAVVALPAQVASASGLRGVHVLNLRSGYLVALRHVRNRPIAGVIYARGHRPATQRASLTPKAPSVTCSEPDCPLVYNGGPVQHTPKVYLLLWGPNWSSEAATASYLEDLYGGLGVGPDDTWSTITSQYGDGTGFPTFTGSVFAGTFHDTSTPPTGVDQTQLAAEASAFATNQNISEADSPDAQIVVATQSGTCPQDFYAPTCFGGSGYYCAWHSAVGYGSSFLTYTNLPYVLDAGTGCGENFVNSGTAGTYDGLSMVAGHEYAETITDPSPVTGWWDPNDPYGGEIGDKCAWSPLSADVTLSTGTFAMQPLFSNSAFDSSGTGCVMSSGIVQTAPAPTVATVVYDAATNKPWSGTEAPGAKAYDSATVTGTAGGPTPTGTVTYSFYDNSSCRGTPAGTSEVTISNGSVPDSATTGALSAGSYSFEASFTTGDDNYSSTVGGCETFNLALSSPLLIITTTGAYGTPLYLETVGGTGGLPTYTVESPGSAGCSLSGYNELIASSAGTCVVTAFFDGSMTPPTTITFYPASQAPLVLTSTSGTYGSPLALATSGGSDGGAVTYSVDDPGTAGCSVTGSSLSSSAAGACTLTATMAGNVDYQPVASPPTTVTISPANQAPLTISSTSGTYGSPLALSTSGGSDGGAVTYSVDDPGSAGCSVSGSTLSAASPGSCTLTATMAGSSGYNPVSSSPTTVTISRAATTTTLGRSRTVITLGDEGVETLTVAVASPGFVPGGTVTIPGTSCRITLVHGGGSCRLSGNELRPGLHRLVARYSGDSDFAPSSSPAATVVVKRAKVKKGAGEAFAGAASSTWRLRDGTRW